MISPLTGKTVCKILLRLIRQVGNKTHNKKLFFDKFLEENIFRGIFGETHF